MESVIASNNNQGVESTSRMSQVTNISQSKNFTHLANVTAGVLNIYQHQRNLSSDNLKVMLDNAEKIFIKTSAFDAALRIVETHGCGIIAGNTGTGKTTISLMIANHFSKQNYNIHFVGDPTFFNFQETVDPRVPTLVILDDLFGNHSLNTSIDKYIYMFNSFLHHEERHRTSDSDQACTKILITSKSENIRKSVSLLPKFQDFFFKQEATLDLSTNESILLTEEQKSVIFEIHMKEVCPDDDADLLNDTSLLQSIAQAESKSLGFPGLCRLFARNYKNVKSAEDFFKNPLIYLRPEVERLMNFKDVRTTAIILMVLCNGKLAFPDLGTAETREKSGLKQQLMLLQEFVQERYLISTDIISTMRGLTEVLTVSKFDEVQFIHPSVFDCAALLLAEMNLAFVIKHCSFKVIHEYLRVCDQQEKGHQPSFAVSESYFKLLAERLADEIRAGNIALTLTHSALMHQKIVDLITHEIKRDLKKLMHMADAYLGQHFLYWATFCNSSDFFSTLLTHGSPSRREVFEAAVGCCLNGNEDVLQIILSSLGPGIIKLRTIQMRDIFPNLTEENTDQGSLMPRNLQLQTPMEEIRQSTKTLLSIATEYKHIAVVNMLKHASESKADHEYAMANASKYRQSDIVNALGDTLSDIHVVDDKGDSHLHIACNYGQLDLLKTVYKSGKCDLEMKGHKGRTLLMTAAASGELAVFEYLLEKGSDITLTDYENNNLLHQSCMGGNKNIVVHVMSMELFDIDSRGYQLWTPLMFAAFHSHLLIVQHLYEQGADIKAKGADDNTALHLTSLYGDFDLFKWLVETEAFDVNDIGQHKYSPLMIATKKGHIKIVDYLVSIGANLNITGNCGCHCLHIACEEGNLDLVKLFLASKRLDINDEGKHDFPPLGASIKCKQVKVFKYLLEQGADLSFVTNEGNNCLHLAANVGADDIARELLETKKFDINEKGDLDRTPVMQALDNGHTDTAVFLISKDADLTGIDTMGKNCLHYACDEGIFAIVEKLSKDAFYGMGIKEKRKEYIKLACSRGHLQIFQHLMTVPEKIPFTSEELLELLMATCTGKNLDIVKILLNAGKEIRDFSIDKRSSSNHLTLLFAAVICGADQIVEFLLKKGSNPLLEDESGNTALHFAAIYGTLITVQLLIFGGDVDIDMRGEHGNTPLMNACFKGRLEIASHLLDKGARTDMISFFGYRCLHLACMGGNLEIVKMLLKTSDADVKDQTGRTAIMYAALHKHPEIVAYFISRNVSLNAVSESGETVLKLACSKGQIETVIIIMNTGKVDINDSRGPNKWTPLVHACHAGHANVAEYLISMGADVEQASSQGGYCLHFACMSGHVFLVSRLLDMESFHVNMRGEKGCTPLMLAASGGHGNLVTFLLNAGADVKLKNSSGLGSIHLAAMEGFLNIVKLLIYKDQTMINTRDSLGTTPILYSLFHKHEGIFEFLFENGADITIERHCGTDCMYTACIAGLIGPAERLLYTGKFDVNKPAIHNWTPLMGACRSGDNYEMYRYLVSQGASLDSVSDTGDNVFHIACMGGNLSIVTELFSLGKFDINGKGFNGWPPLFMACEQGHPRIVSFLIANGANPKFEDSKKNNCLHIACGSGHIEVVKLLLLLDLFDVNGPNKLNTTPLMKAAGGGHDELVQFLINFRTF